MASMKNLMIYAWGVLSTIIILSATGIEGNTGKNSESDILNNLNYLKLEKNLQKINNPNFSRFLEEIGVNQIQKEDTKMIDSEMSGNHAKILEILDDKKKLENLKANLSQARTALKEFKNFHKEWEGKVNIDGDGGKARDLSIKLEDMDISVKKLVKKYNVNDVKSGKSERKLTIQFNGESLSLNQDAIKENLLKMLNLINLIDINIGETNSKEKIYIKNNEILEIIVSSDFEENLDRCSESIKWHKGHIISVSIIKDYLLTKIKEENFNKNVFAESASAYMMTYAPENYLFDFDTEMNKRKTKVKDVNDFSDQMLKKKDELDDFINEKIPELDFSTFSFDDSKLSRYFKNKNSIDAITAIKLISKDNGGKINSITPDLVSHLKVLIKEYMKFKKNNPKKEITGIIDKYSCIIKFLTKKGLFDSNSENICNEKLVINYIFSAIITFTCWNPGNILIAPLDTTRLGQEYPMENIDGRALIALKDENFNEVKQIIFGINVQNKMQIEELKMREIDVEIKNVKDEMDIEKNKDEKGKEIRIKELTDNLKKLNDIKNIVDSIKERREGLINEINKGGLDQSILEIGEFYEIWKSICRKSNSSFLTENDLFGNTKEKGNTETFWKSFSEENKCDLNFLAEN